MKTIILFIFISIFSILTFAQTSEVLFGGFVESFNVDYFEKKIYFRELISYQGQILGRTARMDYDGSNIEDTEYSNVPFFFSKSHKAIYTKRGDSENKWYIYDFDQEVEKEIAYKGGYSLISQDDSKILVSDTSYYDVLKDKIISFPKTSSLVRYKPFAWTNNNYILLWENIANLSTIIKLSISDGAIDTLVNVENYDLGSAIYNSEKNSIYYSTDSSLYTAFLYEYDLSNASTELILDFNKSIDFDNFYRVLRNFSLSPDNKNLAFSVYGVINYLEPIMAYSIERDSTIILGNDLFDTPDIGGYKSDFRWLDNENLAYKHLSDGHILKKLNLANYVSVNELNDNKQIITSKLNVSPNPFNTLLEINLNLAGPGNYKIEITDVNGRRCKTIDLGYAEAGIIKTNWKGTNNHGQKVASGIYFLNLMESSKGEIINTAKIIYLK